MLVFSLLFLLLSNAVTLRRDKSILYSRVSILVLLSCVLMAIESLNFITIGKGVGLQGGLFYATAISHVFHIFIFLISAIILQLTGFYPRKIWIKGHSNLSSMFFNKFTYFKSELINKMGGQFKIIEYPLVLLFIITGATFLVSSGDIVSIFISIELQSYGLYLLSTIYRNSELSTSAGLTYFLLGGLSSCFILLGTSLLYANSGTTSLEGFYVITSLTDIAQEATNNILYWYKTKSLNLSLLIMLVGFLFKVSAAPYHFWSPDVYDAIPTIVTTFVAIIAKISIFIFLLELVHYTSNSHFVFNFNWTLGLLVSSLLSLVTGTVLGLNQFRIKRLVAYSTISHLGFILLALCINSLESIQAFIFYLMQYSITNLNAFIILVSIGFSIFTITGKKKDENAGDSTDEYLYISKIKHGKLLDKDNSPIQLISQLKGYFYVNPVLSLSLAITIFSFVGIPPLIGFFAKQMVLSSALDNGYVFLTFVAILTSVISAVYYLNVIKQIFFHKAENENENKNIMNNLFKTLELHCIVSGKYIEGEKIPLQFNCIMLSSFLTITVSMLTLAILLFILSPQESISMTNILALIIFNT